MNLYKILSILSCVSMLYACIPGILRDNGKKYVVSMSDIKYPNNQDSVETKLNINGFFCDEYLTSTADDRLCLYKDGSASHYGVSKSIYKISRDTLIVNNYGKSNAHWEMFTHKYLIIDRNTLKLIEVSYKDWGSGIITHKMKDQYYYHFHQTVIPPKSKTYLKKKKWIWNDKKEWKAWMKKH